MEEEARQTQKPAVSPPERLGDFFLEIFGPDKGVDLELLPREPHLPTALLEDFIGCAGSAGPARSLKEIEGGIARGARERGGS